MLHPFLNDFANLKDQDIDEKIIELTKKYQISLRLGNNLLSQQILVVLDEYKSERQRRYQTNQTVTIRGKEKSLSDLINID